MSLPPEKISPTVINHVMSRLSPQSVKVIESLAKAKGSTPQEVLSEALRGYLASELPSIDLEGLVQSLKPQVRQAGVWVGRLKGLLKNRNG